MSESQIIQNVFRPLVRRAGAFDLRDDCASYMPGPGQDVVLKTDPIREGVHFFADDNPADIAWKALAVNVSDLAAKAARPAVYLLAVSFPSQPEEAWLRGFGEGLAEAQEAFGLSLIGGDTDRADGPISIAVTVLGECAEGRMVRRGGARPGDVIFVSGTLGESAAGFALRSGAAPPPDASDQLEAAKKAIARYLRPQPRLGLKAALRRHARAAMDLSDGLLKDAGRMADASGCALELEADALPIGQGLDALALDDAERLRMAVAHGDDYEILAAVPPDQANAFADLARAGGVPVCRIGVAVAGHGAKIRASDGTEVDFMATGWDHF
jgi:thiamine-monophosphate kinase